jgi:hypothetical protein
MKKYLLLFLTFIASITFAQDASIIFKTKDVTFYGLDFSRARLIGSFGFNQPAKIQDYHMPDWNYMFIKEKRKYNLSKTFKIKRVNYDFDIVTQRNKDIDIFRAIIDEEYSIEKPEIEQAIAEYKDSKNKGLGLSFMVESLDYHKNIAVIWVTFFDIETGKVLLCEHMRGDAIGLSFRNWWAKAYFNVLKSCQMNYSYWKKTYGKQ